MTRAPARLRWPNVPAMRRIAAIAVLLAAVLVLGVAQLALPGIAAQRIRTRLSAYGSVRSVEVDAFPAIELLWHHAQAIHIDLAAYRSGSGQVGSLLHQLTGVDSLDLSAAQLDIGLLRLRDATLHKRGSELSAAARVSEADLRAGCPVSRRRGPGRLGRRRAHPPRRGHRSRRHAPARRPRWVSRTGG